jgi:uncharacterized protein YecE (DUF72 family)
MIGTSGWTYDSWRGPFYPCEIAKKDWLAWYGSQFQTAEINNSFYRTPLLKAQRDWCGRTPANFVFAWKASKFITHWKRLSDSCANSIALMESRLKILGVKAGPVLFQLPANFEADCGRLSRFIGMLPSRRQYAFEFRHPSWYDDPILDLLATLNVSLCLADHHSAPAPRGGDRKARLCAGVTGPMGAIVTTIPMRPCAHGRAASRRGNARHAKSMCTSTTTRRAQHLATRAAWSSYWN